MENNIDNSEQCMKNEIEEKEKEKNEIEDTIYCKLITQKYYLFEHKNCSLLECDKIAKEILHPYIKRFKNENGYKMKSIEYLKKGTIVYR